MTKNSRPPAEQVTDEELVGRIEQILEMAETPFLTTGMVSDNVDEIGHDQVRKRLKRLSDDGELAHSRSRGLVWWIPPDSDHAGEVDPTEMLHAGPDWRDITSEEIPDEILDEAIERREEDNNSWERMYGKSTEMIGLGAMFTGPGLLVVLMNTNTFEGISFPELVVELGSIVFLIGLLLVASGGTLMAIASILNWVARKGIIPEEPAISG